jgi:RNA polymerase sigma-70 factor, ECF subfamily
LHYTGGLSLREIAKALGISVGTVKSRLNSGLEQLRRRLS